MKNLHSRLGVLALALVLVLGLCACGGENGVETATPAPVETPTVTPTPTATPEPTATPAPTSTPEPTPEPPPEATLELTPAPKPTAKAQANTPARTQEPEEKVNENLSKEIEEHKDEGPANGKSYQNGEQIYIPGIGYMEVGKNADSCNGDVVTTGGEEVIERFENGTMGVGDDNIYEILGRGYENEAEEIAP